MVGLKKIRKDDQFVEHCQVSKKQNMPEFTPGVYIFAGWGGGCEVIEEASFLLLLFTEK